MKRVLIFCALMLLSSAGSAGGERIKDIVDIQGVRGNPLSGVGLVIGLADTGDSTLPSKQMLTNIFRRSGIVVTPSDLSTGNIAVVMVTANLGPFARKGSRIDVDVSAVGDAESLQGGMLLPSPLKGLDGQVYAVSQGPISLGGFSATGTKASITKNHQTVGRIPGGAIVEKQELASFVEQVGETRYITLNLRNSDFATARQIGKAVNRLFSETATVQDAGTIKVRVPDKISAAGIAGFIDEITKPEVKVDVPAVVVINERTGTIVVGKHVSITEVAISQGSLVVKISETERVSQPQAPFSNAGSTEKVPETMIGIQEQSGYLIPVSRTVTVSELAQTLNAIGATPRDMVAIFNALKKAGALQAKLVIM